MARASARHAEGHWFKSSIAHHASLALSPVCAWSVMPDPQPPPLSCRLRRSARLALCHPLTFRHHLRRCPSSSGCRRTSPRHVAAVGRRLPAALACEASAKQAPAPRCSESESRRARLLSFRFRISAAAKPVALRKCCSLRLKAWRGATGGAASPCQPALEISIARSFSSCSGRSSMQDREARCSGIEALRFLI